MFRWVDAIQTGTQHRDCAASGVERRGVGDAVDAARQPTDNGDSVARKIAGKNLAYLSAVSGGLARSYNRH